MAGTQIEPIKTDADHETALRGIEALWGAAEGSADSAGSTHWRP